MLGLSIRYINQGNQKYELSPKIKFFLIQKTYEKVLCLHILPTFLNHLYYCWRNKLKQIIAISHTPL